MAPQEFVDALQQGNQLPLMVGEVARNKALAIALGKVTVVDTNGKPVDLTGFVAVEDEADAAADDAEEKPAKKAPAKKPAAKKAPAAKKDASADAAEAPAEKKPAAKKPAAKKAPAKKADAE